MSTASAARPARVLIVEDQSIMAELLSARLESETEFTICGTARTAADAVREATRTQPDLVVMDQQLASGTGVDATRRISSAVPGARVVMLTAEASPEIVRAALDAGAVGYVPKHALAAQLLGALRSALNGEMVLPVEAVSAVTTDRAREGVLSPREQEVLRLLGEGLDSRSIAGRLGVSYHTAREHAQRVIEKLGARTRLEAVARARESGLL
jgi:DNA-binding NarL/FixJ family response regulator